MYRDFTYIDDITKGITSLVAYMNKNGFQDSVPYSIFNIGNNKPVKLTYFISLIEKAIGIKAKKKFLDFQTGEAVRTAADISKIQKITNFKPKMKIEEGIPFFVNWFKDYYKIKL